MKKTILIGLFLLSGLLVFNQGVMAANSKTVLQAASGGVGGTWYGQMAQLADIINKADPSIELKTVPGAGLANPVRINTGESQVGWGMPTFIKYAVDGTNMYKEPNPSIRGIATGFTLHPLQLFVCKDTGITSIEQIKEKKFPLKVAIGRAGSIDETTANMILDYHGISGKTLKSWGGNVFLLQYGEQVKKIKDRQANAYINMMPIPAPTVQEMILGRPMLMLPLDPKMAEEYEEKYAFSKQKLEPGMYGGGVIEQEMVVPAVNLSLIVNKDVDEGVVYRITKVINENVDAIHKIGPTFQAYDPAVAWKNIGAPLHPGAEKYYREKGYLK